MKKQKFVNWVVFLIVICFSCGNSKSKVPDKIGIEQLLKEKLIGSWGGEWQNEYGELHFINDSIYIAIQDSVYYHIPNTYWWIGEDTIQLRPFYRKYKVSIDGDTLRLAIKNELFEYERIKPEPTSLTDDFFEGYMIRRCNFLVSTGIFNVSEAYKQLYEYIINENLLDTTNYNVEEEYIPIKNAH